MPIPAADWLRDASQTCHGSAALRRVKPREDIPLPRADQGDIAAVAGLYLGQSLRKAVTVKKLKSLSSLLDRALRCHITPYLPTVAHRAPFPRHYGGHDRARPCRDSIGAQKGSHRAAIMIAEGYTRDREGYPLLLQARSEAASRSIEAALRHWSIAMEKCAFPDTCSCSCPRLAHRKLCHWCSWPLSTVRRTGRV